MHDVAQNLVEVKANVAAAAKKTGRKAEDITLVAVSKVHGVDRIRPALENGHRTFGENRVQEAKEKWPVLKDAFPDITLHLIGPLQTNKVKEAVALFDVIESVDREKLARRLAEEMTRQDRRVPVFIQVNTGEEEQKAGILPSQIDEFVHLVRDELGLSVHGLMCIPPVDEEPALHFALLKKIADRNGLKKLSMGMSNDYDVGIQFGATHVRVGTAIFGKRS